MTANTVLQSELDAPSTPQRARVATRQGAVLRLGVAAAVFWLAFDIGSYGVARWTSVAIVVWWAIASGLALGVWPRRHISASAWGVGGLLTAFAALTGLSALWASSAEAPITGMGRALLYVGVLGLMMITASRGNVKPWSDGIAAGLVAVAALALVSRLFPGHIADEGTVRFLPDAQTRLSYPVGYWNGLAILVALAYPLLLGIAVTARAAVVRGLALVPLPVVATTIFLASSRTGVVIAVVGMAAFVALAGHRWAAVGAAVTSLITSIAAVVFVAHQHELVNGPLESAAAAEQGRRAALVIVILGLVAMATYGLLSWRLRRAHIPPALGWVATGLLVAVVAGATIAAHPRQRWEDFTRPPASVVQADYVKTHFLSTNGNWRWQYWQSAVDEFRTRPVLGRGAGSYEAWWAEHGGIVGFIGNAHSLYFETLGELGAVGLVLLIGAFVLGLSSGARRALQSEPYTRDSAGAVTAAFLAYAVAAGVDWMWEIPAVSIVGMALLGLAVGPTTDPNGSRVRGNARTRALRLLLITLSVAVLAVQVDLFAANAKIRESQQAVTRGDLATAVRAAKTARTLQPWAASPYLQLALVDEGNGRIRPAQTWIRQAIARDGRDWRLWLIAARIETKLGDIGTARSSFEQARRLNPRSPVFTTARSSTNP